MKIELSIGQLAELIEEFTNTPLEHNREVETGSFGISVQTPNGTYAKVNHFIKKCNLPIIEVVWSNGYSVKVADTHRFHFDGNDVFANNLTVGDCVNHRDGIVSVVSTTPRSPEDCFDVAIDAPHLYCDANGLVHHNTLMTAVLANAASVHGRVIVIVPNTDLVAQTAADFVNLGLDVGVYYGAKKEFDKTHTICTWQSLNVLMKNDIERLGEFLSNVNCVLVDECFDGDSLILTPSGYVPIKMINPGDVVLNYSEETGCFKEDIVIKRHENLTKSSSEKMYEMEFDNGTKIKVTGNHKFLTNLGWVRADELDDRHEIVSTALND